MLFNKLLLFISTLMNTAAAHSLRKYTVGVQYVQRWRNVCVVYHVNSHNVRWVNLIWLSQYLAVKRVFLYMYLMYEYIRRFGSILMEVFNYIVVYNSGLSTYIYVNTQNQLLPRSSTPYGAKAQSESGNTICMLFVALDWSVLNISEYQLLTSVAHYLCQCV